MVLVTGAENDLGRELTKTLSALGFGTVALSASNIDKSGFGSPVENIKFIQADLLNVPDVYEAVEGIDTVFHCGIIDEFTPEKYSVRLKHNVRGTANLVNAMLHHKVKKLIFFSSLSAFASEPKKMTDVRTLTDKNEWTTEEAFSILMAEREVWRGNIEGLETVVINAADILIPREEGCHLFASVVRFLKSGSADIYPSKIYYVSLEDLVGLAMKIFRSDTWGERYIAIGGSCDWEEFYAETAQALSYNFKPKVMSKKTVLCRAAVDWIKSKLTGSERKFKKKNANWLMQEFKFDGSLTTEKFEMKWQSLGDVIQDFKNQKI